jgi:hypothetical protein
MGPTGCPKMPARNYSMLRNNAEKHRSQYHYFGGSVGSKPGLDLLAKRKPPVPDENRIKVKDYYFYIRFKNLRINTENLTLERQMDAFPTFREYTPKLK